MATAKRFPPRTWMTCRIKARDLVLLDLFKQMFVLSSLGFSTGPKKIPPIGSVD